MCKTCIQIFFNDLDFQVVVLRIMVIRSFDVNATGGIRKNSWVFTFKCQQSKWTVEFKMIFLFRILILFILVHCVWMQISNGLEFQIKINNISDTNFVLFHFIYFRCIFSSGNPQFCLSNDVNDGVCSVIENFFAFGPFQQVVDLIAGSLTAFTNILQVQEVLLYITQSFGQNPLNTTDYESISKSFNLIIFHPWVDILWECHWSHSYFYSMHLSFIKSYKLTIN